MSSMKCTDCGLVNFATAEVCKRCGALLTGGSVAAESSARASSAGDNDETFFDHFPPRRDGKLLVVTEESVLPERCVRCNAPATKTVKRRLNWASGSISPFSLLSVWAGLIIYSLKTDTATIHIGLCSSHYYRRVVGMVLGGLLIGPGLLMGLITVFNHDYWLALYGAGAVLAGAIVIVLLTPTVTAQSIERPYIWLKGAHRDFLDSL